MDVSGADLSIAEPIVLSSLVVRNHRTSHLVLGGGGLALVSLLIGVSFGRSGIGRNDPATRAGFDTATTLDPSDKGFARVTA